MIDTHSAVKKLQSGGFNEQQAEVLVFVVNDLSNQTVTKSELSSELGKVSTELKLEIEEVRSAVQEVKNELKLEIQEVRSELRGEILGIRSEIRELRSDIQSANKISGTNMRWILGILIAVFTLALAPVVSNIIKFW